MNDPIAEISIALERLRYSFLHNDIPCPMVLEYTNVQEAYRALPMLRRATRELAPIWVSDAEGQPLGQIQIQGFTIRFPARIMATQGEGAYLDDGISGRVFQD
jgi:hypothetical protein